MCVCVCVVFQTRMALFFSDLEIDTSTHLGSSFPSQGKHLYMHGLSSQYALLVVHLSESRCFCFRRQLVSSYKGKFGYVEYYVKAVMEMPCQSNVECKKYFEVEEPIDVNTPDLTVSQPQQLSSCS